LRNRRSRGLEMFSNLPRRKISSARQELYDFPSAWFGYRSECVHNLNFIPDPYLSQDLNRT
jgi:hypothetical protein